MNINSQIFYGEYKKRIDNRQKKKTRLLLAVGIVIAAGVGFDICIDNKLFFTILNLLVLFALLTIFNKLVRDENSSTLARMVIIALILRLAFVLLTSQIHLIEEADAAMYHKEAVRISSSWLEGNYHTPTMGTAYGYIYFVSLLYAGFVPSKYIPIAINCFVSVATGVYIYKIAFLIWKNEKIARCAAFFGLFMPGILIWSTTNLKDSWVNLFVVISIYYLIKIRIDGYDFKRIIAVILCISLLWTVRFYLSILLIPLFIFTLGAAKRRNIIYLSLLFIVVVAGFLSLFSGSEVKGVRIGIEALDASRRELASAGGSETGLTRKVRNIGEAITLFPIGLIYFLFAPFPWSKPTSLLYLLTYPEMSIIYLLWPLIIIGLIKGLKLKENGAEVILIFIIASIILYSLGAGNIGTLYRMRIATMLLLFVFSAEPISRAFVVRRELIEKSK